MELRSLVASFKNNGLAFSQNAEVTNDPRGESYIRPFLVDGLAYDCHDRPQRNGELLHVLFIGDLQPHRHLQRAAFRQLATDLETTK